MSTRAFAAIPANARGGKPRRSGLTEIRGPYYTMMGPRYLEDILETVGDYVDGLKFAGGSFSLLPRSVLERMIALAHQHQVYVSTGGWIEYVLRQGPRAVRDYLAEAKALGFDVLEISTGFISLPQDDLLRLVARVREAGMKPKPELGIQFGAGGSTAAAELAAEGVRDADWVIGRAKACLAAGAEIIMIESEGLTENVDRWRVDVVSKIAEGVGLDNVMFEAADPAVFEWYLKHYGIDVNLFVDHSQIVQLECLRAGIWGTHGTWGRIASFKDSGA
ncbi:MAG TPA: phosphosulfolactate synthase [Steroidobacteraceae bacterium]|nr:phosphosulfolactate synthase [Steroidobacteraceae bacterium]